LSGLHQPFGRAGFGAEDRIEIRAASSPRDACENEKRYAGETTRSI
jgi:hypothetical protein